VAPPRNVCERGAATLDVESFGAAARRRRRIVLAVRHPLDTTSTGSARITAWASRHRLLDGDVVRIAIEQGLDRVRSRSLGADRRPLQYGRCRIWCSRII
jgi:hypothetical protein